MRELDPEFKRNSLFVFLAYFCSLFSYPFIRSVAQSVFYDHYTAQDYSLATFFSVIGLIVAIFFSNNLQEKIGAQKLFGLIAGISLALLAGSYVFLENGVKIAAFFMFAIKEAYIVLIIHLILAYANATFSLEQVKRLYGPLGAFGSIGGILGGQLTRIVSSEYGVIPAFGLGLVAVVCAAFSFYGTKRMVLTKEEQMEVSPLRSVKNVRKYVLLIAGVVCLTQWVIFIADLQFNILFEKAFETKGERTAYLGNLYSLVNVFALFLQFVIIPWLLVRVSTRKIFFAIPVFYLALILGGIGAGGGALLASAFVFVTLKGSDYSIFAATKEVMYFPLDKIQKFGAKYITDMFVYRLGKALIAFVMAQYLLKDIWALTSLQALFIFAWMYMAYLLFKEQDKINKEVSERL